MSQRQAGFNGGIQSGTVARPKQTTLLERLLRKVNKSEDVFLEGVRKGLEWKRKLGSEDLFPNASMKVAGCEPDGGVWLKDGVPVLVTELKHQGVDGNAEARFFRNHHIFQSYNPLVIDICFCTGEGFFGNRPEHVLNTGFLLENPDYKKNSPWNTGDGNSIKLYRYKDINMSYIEKSMTQAIIRGMREIC